MKSADDSWFLAKVQEALADTRPAVPHQQVMDEAQALIDKKRRAQARVAGKRFSAVVPSIPRTIDQPL